MLEFFHCRLANILQRDIKLHAFRGILNGGKGRLAHDALQHHAACNLNHRRRCVQGFLGLLPILRDQLGSVVFRAKIIREGLRRFRANRGQLLAALGNDVVFVYRCGVDVRVLLLITHGVSR